MMIRTVARLHLKHLFSFFFPTTHFKINWLLTREMATYANPLDIMRTFITQPPLVIFTLSEHGVLLGHHEETQSRVQFNFALRIERYN